MKLRLIIPTLLALEAADGRTVRGARRQGRKRGIVRAMRRCYDAFVGYEECLIDADDCEDLRNDYFDCMYTTEEGDVYLDCSSSSTSTAEKDKEDRSVLSTSSTVTSSSFGTQMFEELCKENSGNVLFSPLSVYRALEMVEDGATASSDNRAELDRLLGPLKLREQVKALQAFDTTTGDVQLNMATSIWANDLKDSYIDHMLTDHSADGFDLPRTYAPVDDWIADKTKGKITKLMGNGDLDDLTVALLVDAVYFKGTWTYSFDPQRTSSGEFHYRDGRKEEVRFMRASRGMDATKTSSLLGGASLVALDYGENADFMALFILPKSSDDSSMEDVVVGLNNQPLLELIEETSNTPVDLRLPRFQLNGGPTQLKTVLSNMDIKIAFDKEVLGKFNRMSNDKLLYIEDVHHGAFVDVNEEGTEAAAATVVVVNTRSRPRVPPFELTFDRPFVLAIVHRSGIPLFIGKVEEPVFT